MYGYNTAGDRRLMTNEVAGSRPIVAEQGKQPPAICDWMQGRNGNYVVLVWGGVLPFSVASLKYRGCHTVHVVIRLLGLFSIRVGGVHVRPPVFMPFAGAPAQIAIQASRFRRLPGVCTAFNRNTLKRFL